MRSREARNVFTRLAELSVHGANVQKGQIVLVQAEIDASRKHENPAFAGLRLSGSDGTRTRDLRRDRPLQVQRRLPMNRFNLCHLRGLLALELVQHSMVA